MKQAEEQKPSFLQRWSDRKLQGEQQLVNTSETSPAQAVDTPPVKTDADMPSLESLSSDSDFSDFMSPGVSEALRKAALRKLFHMPHLNVVDGLDDYAEDFTQFEPLGDIVTHHARHMLEVEAKRLQEQQQQVVIDEPADIDRDTTVVLAQSSSADEESIEQESIDSVGQQHEHS